MAARILHRLRHALAGEGGREERAERGPEAEDCPESSELEDDTEGLSTRLSGTLSFTGPEEEDDEEDEEEEAEEREHGAGEELGEAPPAAGAAAEDGGRCRGAEGTRAAAGSGCPAGGGGGGAPRADAPLPAQSGARRRSGRAAAC